MGRLATMGNIFGVAAALYCADGIVRKGWLRGHVHIMHKADDERMKRILRRMSTVHGRFWPVCWAHDAYAQFAVFMLYKLYYWNALPVDRHVIACDDGGRVAVDVYGAPRGQPELPASAPLMLIMHTITGRTQDEMELAKVAYSRGWRACLLVRRGHMGTLAHPKFNLMGCVDDSRRMISHVQTLFPEASFIGACGISAGSGQVVSYIGQQHEGGPVQAAVSLCPAYSIENAFANFQQRSPLLARVILAGLKSFFLAPNEEVLRNVKGFQECLESTSVQDFMEAHVRMAGYEDFQEYLEASNPMQHYAGSRIPCLILNALDDPLCVEENIRFDIASGTPNYCLCLTNYGSHVTFREGLLGQSSFMHRVALDFLEAARREEIAGRSS